MSQHPDPAGTDPREPLGALAGRLTEAEAMMRSVAVGAAHETAALAAALNKLTARVDGLSPQAAKDVAKPAAWAQTATAKDWTELVGWVDWLAGAYDLQPSRAVLPCWPAHPGAVEELAALRTAWREASTAARAKELNHELADWHDRVHRCLPRLREVLQQRSCQDKHTRPRPGRPTDPDLLDTARAGAAPPAPTG